MQIEMRKIYKMKYNLTFIYDFDDLFSYIYASTLHAVQFYSFIFVPPKATSSLSRKR